MRVTVLGAGGIGLGYAALLCARGHAVTMWSPSGAAADAVRRGESLTATGLVAGSFRPLAAVGCAQAAEGAQVVIVAVPGYGHRRVIDELAPNLREGQIVIISAHLSFSALYLSRRLAERAIRVPIVAWATTVTAGRRSAPLSVDVSVLRSMIDIACVPVGDIARAESVCCELFGERFERSADLLAISLSNLNPPVHMANSLLNFTRIERGERWENYGCITEGVGRLVEALDRERLALAAAFGLQVRTIARHFTLSFGIPPGSMHEMAQEHNRRIGGKLEGPKTVDTRYVLEDVPFGLVPLVELGRLAGVPMPLHQAGVELFGTLYGRDFRAENDLLGELGLEQMGTARLQRLVREGWA
ncbi:MAG: NAD/NADP octopine/nopaline dehydrogenase family protein [Burkholderiaceae bacterium]|nr:NAD/NADP octopine/nopaline dehydrogenase family protein [Burkholderiaceae bacterium]